VFAKVFEEIFVFAKIFAKIFVSTLPKKPQPQGATSFSLLKPVAIGSESESVPHNLSVTEAPLFKAISLTATIFFISRELNEVKKRNFF
jgi:hypothetical protein